jgi:zinc protease
MAGKAASVGTSIGELHETVNGYAAPRDVETMFQLVHLYFTSPRRDTTAWQAFRQRGREMLRNRGATPESAFGDTLTAVISQGHPRMRPFTAAMYDSLDIDRALGIYRQRFADAGDFTFFLVGNFRPDDVRPLVERYLGSLPGGGARETWVDPGIRPPEGVVRRTVRRGVEPKARTTIFFSGPAQFSREARSDIISLADALEIRLRESLREDLSGTYGVSVSGSVSRDPVPQYSLAIDFNADPARLEELARAAFAEIDSIRARGVPLEVVGKVREAHRLAKEIALRENSTWLSALIEYERLGWDFRWIDDPPLSATLTQDRIRAAARLYLNPRRYVRVSLVPEGGDGEVR